MIRSLPAVVLLLGACGPDYDLRRKPDDPVTVSAEIVVDPQILDFGEKSSLDRVTDHVTILNEGLSTLSIDELRFDAPGSFELVAADPFPWDLAPNEQRTFEVAFQPEAAGSLEGFVTVVSNDHDEPEVRVDVVGIGALAHLEITPNPMEFGSGFVPCGESDNFWIVNRGSEPLDVTSITVEGSAEGVEITPPSLPLTLYKDQPVAVPVAFDRATTATVDAELVVESTDPAGTQRVPITGSARFAAEKTEDWEVPEAFPLNIVFAVDQSCSMFDEQTALTAQFQTFRNILEGAQTDWKIGVVTGTDSQGRWCFEGGVITPQTANWGVAFENAVIHAADNGETEKLLNAVSRNLWDSSRGGPPSCNAAFTSPTGTPLHIIILSDESDQSPDAWSIYLQNYRSFAGAAAQLMVHAIVDKFRGPCGGPSPGAGQYATIAQNTGGFLLDICSGTWASAVGSIAQKAVADLDLYKLKDRNVARGNVAVDEDSLRVWFDGVEVFPPAWTWSPGDIGIRFSPNPPSGTEVTITYGIRTTCF